MAAQKHFLARLLELPRLEDQSVRRGVFRQTIASLGLEETGGGLMALAGADPKALARSIQMVLADGLFDDLDFIAPAAAAVALYQIAGALPLGAERRAIGRKVLAYLYQGNAETFATLASRMAMGSTRALSGAGIMARLSLVLELRSSTDAAIDRLALAIVGRRQLARKWLSTAATGSLPERRFAARLLERAAREGARRALDGDTHPLRLFDGAALTTPAKVPHADSFDLVAAAWHTLLADRETLVWRHVAIARGLLSGVMPQLVEETDSLLQPELTPTEWRRGATSLVARITSDPQRGLGNAMGLLEGPLLRRDPGIAMAMVWGLSPVAEIEPEAAEELLTAIARSSPISVAESVVELRQQLPGFGSRAAELGVAALRASLAAAERDDGLSSLATCILRDLERGEGNELSQAVNAARQAFDERGPQEAFTLAREALSLASAKVAQLESLSVRYDADAQSSEPRRQAMALLRELDSSLGESRTLSNLLLLERPPNSTATGVPAIDDLDARMARWLLAPERRSASPEEIKAQATLQQRQLRMLLHLIDGGNTDFGDDQQRRLRVHARWMSVCQVWVDFVRRQPSTRLTRAIIATVARALDALVRDGAAETVDVFLFTATHFSDSAHIAIVAEASMYPDIRQLLACYVKFVNTPYAGTSSEQTQHRLAAFREFLDAFPTQTTLRAEAFRTTAWRLVRALESVMIASSLRALVPTESSSGAGALAAIEDAIVQMQELVVGAERRCSDTVHRQRAIRPRPYALAHSVEHAVNTLSDEDLLEALSVTAKAAETTLPGAMATLVTQTLPRLSTLQLDRPSALPSAALTSESINLPGWLPSRRILGGFYVLNRLGGGNVGTVFAVKRAEERHEPHAERFALKVPEYNATVARTMSEDEFHKLFREEAGALLSIPEHPNIARFVTFDAGCKPKPILVTELIEGVNCDRVISSGSLNTLMALTVIDGVLSGLAAMHSAGVAHLDVKPSNVILSEGGRPVLVDFGLAGRKLRRGCATLCYGAPEIWIEDGSAESPASAADVYAFGCFAFELLTAQTLFDGHSDVAIIAAHVSHDGLPQGISYLAQHPSLQPLARFLSDCLRRAPEDRSTMEQLRTDFAIIARSLHQQPWPIRLKGG